MKDKIGFWFSLMLSVIICSCSQKENPEPTTVPVTSLIINPTSITLKEGESTTITATVSPSNASNKTVIWSSSNASVANVSDGKVSAVSPGSAEIYAISDDNGMKATCKVTVESNSVIVSDRLNINITDITSSGCVVSITTTSTKTYYCDIIDKATWDEYGGDAVWNAFISERKKDGSLGQMIVSKSNSFDVSELDAEKEYIFFAAFCDKNGVKDGEFFTSTFKTKANYTGEENLNINITNITESGCDVSITTSSTKTYYWDIIEKSTWDEYGGDAVWNAYISEIIKGGQIDSGYLVSGNDAYTFKGLETNTGYVVFAAFCDKSGTKSGNIFSQSFTTQTGETPGGDDVITSNSISINPINSNNLTQKSVSVSAEVKTVKGTSVIEKGFKYYDVLSPLEQATNWITVKVSGTSSSYSTTISNLYEYRPYQIKAYAIIRNDSTLEQEEIETKTVGFKTLEGPATISLTEVWGVSCTSAILKILLTNVGSSTSSGQHSGFVLSTSSNPTIDTGGVIDITYYATRDKEGGYKVTNLKPNTKYYARAYMMTDYGVTYSAQVPFTTYPQPTGAVDLGLPSGVLWSDHNLGGEKPGDYGGYFAWGETKEKSSYTASNSRANGKTGSFISSVQPYILLPQYDAASVIWGNGWRLPTEKELSELDSKCSKKYVTKQNSLMDRQYMELNLLDLMVIPSSFLHLVIKKQISLPPYCVGIGVLMYQVRLLPGHIICHLVNQVPLNSPSL